MEAVAVDTSFAPSPLAATGTVAWLSELRRAAFARFAELGFPTPKNEDWRYTGIQPITGTNWIRAAREPELAEIPPAGVRVRRLSEALRDAEPLLGRIARFESSAFAALNTAMLEDALVVEIAKGAVVAEPIRITFRSGGASQEQVQYPRVLILAGERSQASVVQAYAGDGRYSHQRRDRDRPRRGRAARALRPAAGEPGRVPRPHARGAPVAREPLHVPQPGLRGRARAHRHLRPARRRGRRVHAERPLRRPRRAAPRQPHGRRPREAALRQPRALQGRPRRRGARRLPRQGHRAAGRAEDRRRPDQQEPAPLAPGARQLHARPRDPGRRRQVQARLDDRAARRRGRLLPALARDRRGGRARDADAGLRRGPRRADQDPGAAGGSRAGARASGSPAPPRRPRDEHRRARGALRLRRRRHPAGLPHPRDEGLRQAARLPRQCRLGPEAARRDRRGARRLREVLRQHPPRRPLALGPRDRRLRRRAREDPRAS